MKIRKFFKRNLKWITIIIVMMIIIGVGLWKYYLLDNDKTSKEIIPVVEEIENIEKDIEEEVVVVENVFVDIKGEVVTPGVYEIEKNKRVIDVIKLAGGFTENADTSFVNLAKNVVNEMVIIIYSKDEVKKALESKEEIIKIVEKECVCPEIKNDACLNKEIVSNDNLEDEVIDKENNLVNINTATLEELQTLTGIGESKAQAIITYREEVGSFKTIEDLMNVSGIGEALYEKIKNRITV